MLLIKMTFMKGILSNYNIYENNNVNEEVLNIERF